MLLEKPPLSIPCVLDARGPQILAMLEPCVQLAVGAPASTGESSSKLFGAPFLRHPGEWPRTPEGRPMFFVGQVNLADLPEAASARLWARSGLLSFFYDLDTMPCGLDPDDRYRFRLLWNPDIRRGRAMKAMSGAPVFDERPLSGSLTWRLPSEADDRFLLGAMDEAEFNSYSDLRLGMTGHEEHRLLGPADWIEGDSRGQCQKMAMASWGESHDSIDWRLLWQISGEPGLSSAWGGDGKVYIMISEQDLAQARFARSWVIVQEG